MVNNARSGRSSLSLAKRYNFFFYFRHVVLLVWSTIVLFPIFWMISTSFKDSGDWVAWPPNWMPSFLGGGYEPTLHNYRQIFTFTALGEELSREATEQAYSIWGALGDSASIASISSLVALLLGTFLAYSISRFNVGGKNFRYIILTIRMVPPIVIAIPIVMYYAVLIPHATETLFQFRFSLYDSYVGLGLLYTATTLPFVIWMMLSFIDEVPYTLEHAARIMGSSRIYTLRRVVIPLVAPGMVVTFLFIFILNWSEFLLALTLTQPKVSTMPVLLNKFQSAVEGRLYGPQAAIGTVITIPVVILGVLIQKHLITGFSFGTIRK
ncbi:MAG: carbohydrate ABC transporter permease [Nitrospinota bacterium]|nr:carbohydrate ABC transporter permease [Nitrospinota bacterium]